MAKLHGEKHPIKQPEALSFSPATGWVSTKRYVGTLDEVKALAAQIKDEKTDDNAGTPPTVKLTITPTAGGLASLDISYDDDIGTGVEFSTWSLKASDYEKNILTHPTVRALSNTCPDEYAALLVAKAEIKKGTKNAKDIINDLDCTLAAALDWEIYYHDGAGKKILNQLDKDLGGKFGRLWEAGGVEFMDSFNMYDPTDDMTPSGGGRADEVCEQIVGKQFKLHSVWFNALDNKAFGVTTEAPDVVSNHTWTQLGSVCCAAQKVILSYFRDGIESFIDSRYVLQKATTVPTSTKEIYSLRNVNTRVSIEQMSASEGLPSGLKFALPTDGEWLKKTPSVQYQRTKMSVTQEYWHADDWNDYIYPQASY